MIPWGAIISLAGLAYSGAQSAINNRKEQRQSDAKFAEDQAYYKAKANEGMSRSDIVAANKEYDRSAEKALRNAQATATINGLTPDYTTAVQGKIAEGKANLLANQSTSLSNREDRYDEMYQKSKDKQYETDMARIASRNATAANVAANAATAFGSIVDSYNTKSPTSSSTTNTTTQVSSQTDNSGKLATAAPITYTDQGNGEYLGSDGKRYLKLNMAGEDVYQPLK